MHHGRHTRRPQRRNEAFDQICDSVFNHALALPWCADLMAKLVKDLGAYFLSDETIAKQSLTTAAAPDSPLWSSPSMILIS